MTYRFEEQVKFVVEKFNQAVLQGVPQRLHLLQTPGPDPNDVVRVKIQSLSPNYSVSLMPPFPDEETLTQSDCLEAIS